MFGFFVFFFVSGAVSQCSLFDQINMFMLVEVLLSLNGLNEKIEMCIPQSLSKVISSNVHSGGIPCFKSSNKVYDDNVLPALISSTVVAIPTIPSMRHVPVLNRIVNILNINQVNDHDTSNSTHTRRTNSKMVPVLGAPGSY